MAKQPPPGQEQRAYQPAKERPAERPAGKQTHQPAERVAEPIGSTVVQDTNANTKQKPGMELGAQKATAGRNGERNILIEKIHVPVGNAIPCRFNIKTLPGNELEVTLEQAVYRKTFTGQGTVSTTVIPVAPIGTPGKVTVRDITTGEIAEQPWQWHLIGGASLSLWALLKKLLGFS